MITRRREDKGQGVPTWIVSFSDMITLLLAFFVLLQAFAKKRDPELFFIGQGSFRSNIRGFGVPGWLFGREFPAEDRQLARKHPTDEGPPQVHKPRIIDPDDAKIRKAFQDIARTIETETADIAAQEVRVIPTSIVFQPGGASLGRAALAELDRIAVELAATVHPDTSEVHVVGLCAEPRSAREQWMVSARRALEARDYLSSKLSRGPTTSTWKVRSIGAGEGGRWARTFGVLPDKSCIVIAIMGAT